jgi:hypothetical protein
MATTHWQADCKFLASLLQITGKRIAKHRQPDCKSPASRLQITGKPIANYWQAKCKFPTTSELNFSRVFYIPPTSGSVSSYAYSDTWCLISQRKKV